jgi:hypothetical protein
MKERRGKFAVVVTEDDKWLNFADLEEDKDCEILKGVISDAQDYARKNQKTVLIYVAEKEIEISPSKR